jgi:COMPASS component SPP1
VDKSLTDDEQRRIQKIENSLAELTRRKAVLRDREKFVALVKKRREKVLKELDVKDICGYDNRLSWAEEEFAAWRDSAEGRQIFDSGVLGPPPLQEHEMDADNGNENANHRGLCQKKRCERHRDWQRLQLHDMKFEEMGISEEMERLKEAERGIRQRARIRQKSKENGGVGLAEGTVETIGE